MKTSISFILIMTALLCIPVTAQNCVGGGGGGTDVTSVPTPDSLTGFNSHVARNFSTNSNSFGGSVLNYSDMSLFNSAANTIAEKMYPDVEGSPFLSDEFLTGMLVTNEGDVIVDVPMKINIYSQEVVAKNHVDANIVLDPSKYQEIILTFEGRDLRFRRSNDAKPNAFYEVLFESADLTLIKEHYATVKEGTNNGISSTEKKFSHRTRYFIQQENGVVEKTRLKKKSLLALLPNEMAEGLAHYADKNKIKFAKEADFVRLFAGYINEQTIAGKNH